MALTLRDWALPSRSESWRVLRGLRVSPPGAAADDRDRSGTFQTALEQSQQLMDAAERAGYATRPLQLFYALSQGGRAVAAASVRLPTTSPDPNRPGQFKSRKLSWKLRGHGITAKLKASSRIADVVVKGAQTGSLPGVAQALGTRCLVPNEEIRVGDLWALLPESFAAPLEAMPAFPALSFNSTASPRQTSNGYDKATLGHVPSSVRETCGDDQNKLREFLDHYPSLHGWAYPFGNGNPLGWEQDGADPNFNKLPLYWPYPAETSPAYAGAIPELKATGYRTAHDRWVFPRIGSMTEPLHPLLAWWAVLLALSTIARYEPCSWASLISIDSSADANAVELLLDKALDAIPSILLEGIRASLTTDPPSHPI